MRLPIIVMSLVAVLAAGCTDSRFQGRPDLTVVPDGQLPPPTRADLVPHTRAYFIGPFDRLKISVYGIAEMTQEVQADASGRISLPLAGVIEASGLQPTELAAAIADRLRGRYVRDPQVTVNLEQANSQTVTVTGEVREPGIFPVVGRMTLLQAITRAKGFGETAQQSRVVVFRRVENQQMAALYDVRAIRLGAYADPEIYPNDTVIVGESNARRVFREAVGLGSILLTPLVTLLR